MYVYLSKGVFLSEGNCFEESGLSLNEINFENQDSFTMKWFVFKELYLMDSIEMCLWTYL